MKRSSLAVTRDGTRVDPSWIGSCLSVDGLSPGSLVDIRFPVETEKVTAVLPSINARPFRGAPSITGRFRGSTCIGLEPAAEAITGAEPVLYPLFDRPQYSKTPTPMKEVVRKVIDKPIRWY